ncbi:MAG TPA: multicopper oxidase family protein [Bryobacteraceae bacterium]|jgi:spore coat protein A|nr:multicopper oxidase family protein [Bryobacteraceae bacterium]
MSPRFTRRQILSSLAAATLARRTARAQSDELTTNTLFGIRLEPFVDPLPIPRAIRLPATPGHTSAPERIILSQFRQKLHRDLPPSLVWGFNGTTPGPTLVAARGCPAHIEWHNRLPDQHPLAVDHTLDGAGPDIPAVRTVIHLHGGHVSAENDGYPEHWIIPGQAQRTHYPNRQPTATLWYHDHAMGITRLNAVMGLAGLYLLHDPDEQRLHLPSGPYDIPLILQDRILDAGGQLAYPVGPSADHPWVSEFFGTHVLVNGKVWPYLTVEPRLYRFRLLNASNSRIYQMALHPEQPFYVIASDGGLLREPVESAELLLAPGERLDLLIDFRERQGRRLNLVNYGRAPYPSGGSPVPGFVLQFRVERPLTPVRQTSEIPNALASVPRLAEAAAVKTRRLKLVEFMGPDKRLQRTLLDGKRFMDPVSEDPLRGTAEIWEFVNTTMDTHPIHLHAIHFQLLDRRAFDVRRYQSTSEVFYTGPLLGAAAAEQGWKDTIICPPGQVTRILAPFHAEPGRFVWHCHMLEHEDNEMMRPYVIRSA